MDAKRAAIEQLVGGDASSANQHSAVWVSQLRREPDRQGRVLFPGAFNPLHTGHMQMAELAARMLNTDVDYEISIINVDKRPLVYDEIAHRAQQFATRGSLWLTNAPTFVAKSFLFPGATFVVGADTISRIAEAKYYDGDDARDAAIARLMDHGCRFLVFGRLCGSRYSTLADLKLPALLHSICDEVGAAEFRVDISSTELRAGGSRGKRTE